MYQKIIYNILLLLACFTSVYAGNEDVFIESKTIHKTYSASDIYSLDVVNKYGSVRINSTNSDSIRFEIRIKSESPKSDVAKNMVDMTDVEFLQGFHKLSAKTFFNSKLNFLKQSIQDITTTIDRNQKITIDYIIFLPKKITLNIENRFGDIYMDDVLNPIGITLSHGNFEAGNLANLKTVDIKYGKINVSSANDLEVNIQFGTLNIRKMQDLKLKSLSSTIDIYQSKDVWITSKNDKIKLGKLNKYNGSSSFSEIQINELETSILQTAKYGNMTIYKIKSEFSDVSISGNNTTLTLGFDNDCSFNFNINMEYEKAFHSVASKFKIEKQNQVEEIKTYKGNSSGKSSKISNVNINLKSSKLFLS